MIAESLIILLLALFIWIGIKTNNAFVFMILCAVSIPLGLFLPDLVSSDATTTGVDMVFGLGVCMYGLLCFGLSLRLMLQAEGENA